MIIPANAADFAALLRSHAPRQFTLVSGNVIASPEVMRMLADLAAAIASTFAPSAWMIEEEGEVVGLLSVVRVPVDGELHIGYGIAPSRQRGGVATRAIASLIAWARMDARVTRITAETAVDNVPSQKVLERNGFRVVGERVDDEDGALLCWELAVA